jgi:class 3 adenylate cyclase
MKCPRRQIENREEARFCDSCGQQIATTPSKKTSPTISYADQLSRIKKYLPRGLAEKVLAQRDKIGGERKQVTVLFCDMKGFTRFSENLPPDEVYGIMDQVYEILMRQVHDLGGDGKRDDGGRVQDETGAFPHLL